MIRTVQYKESEGEGRGCDEGGGGMWLIDPHKSNDE